MTVAKSPSHTHGYSVTNVLLERARTLEFSGCCGGVIQSDRQLRTVDEYRDTALSEVPVQRTGPVAGSAPPGTAG